ncbi:hypothetical protein DMH04_02425 [Kibdelosporangium aridum]|uniref:DUF3592 domain-containing protein n=1 Tax=Kibdelosporangium aridum TaxID=2030 RepID=A0A428ZVC8_KIBAR|nr:hypothetical protein [Kibdelosporangium aridum]RSM91843.1 hypothetical protein DMH04_02425 [Kibdelosporangium aridum]
MRLLGAISLPVFVAGLGLLAGYVTGDDLNAGFWSNVLAGFIGLVAIVVTVFTLQERAYTYLHLTATVVTGIALCAGFLGAALGINQWILVGSGRTAECTVTSVTDRVEQRSDVTVTLYDTRLECAGGVPDHITTTEPLAEAGRSIEVIYDPDAHIATRPAEHVEHWRIYLWITLAGFGSALVIGLAEVLLHRR